MRESSGFGMPGALEWIIIFLLGNFTFLIPMLLFVILA